MGRYRRYRLLYTHTHGYHSNCNMGIDCTSLPCTHNISFFIFEFLKTIYTYILKIRASVDLNSAENRKCFIDTYIQILSNYHASFLSRLPSFELFILKTIFVSLESVIRHCGLRYCTPRLLFNNACVA